MARNGTYPQTLILSFSRFILKMRNGGHLVADLIPGRSGLRRFSDLLDHYDDILGSSRHDMVQAYYEEILRLMGLEDAPDPDYFLECYGRMAINSFHILDEDTEGRCAWKKNENSAGLNIFAWRKIFQLLTAPLAGHRLRPVHRSLRHGSQLSPQRLRFVWRCQPDRPDLGRQTPWPQWLRVGGVHKLSGSAQRHEGSKGEAAQAVLLLVRLRPLSGSGLRAGDVLRPMRTVLQGGLRGVRVWPVREKKKREKTAGQCESLSLFFSETLCDRSPARSAAPTWTSGVCPSTRRPARSWARSWTGPNFRWTCSSFAPSCWRSLDSARFISCSFAARSPPSRICWRKSASMATTSPTISWRAPSSTASTWCPATQSTAVTRDGAIKDCTTSRWPSWNSCWGTTRTVEGTCSRRRRSSGWPRGTTDPHT